MFALSRLDAELTKGISPGKVQARTTPKKMTPTAPGKWGSRVLADRVLHDLLAGERAKETEGIAVSFMTAVLGSDAQSRDYAPVLKWILVNVLIVFGVLVLWYFGLIQAMLETDRTKMSLVILAVFIVTTLHCLYQTVVVSRELIAARKVRDAVVAAGGRALTVADEKVITSTGQALEPGIVTDHIANLITKARTLGEHHLDQTLLLRSLADQLRSREKLGLFISESLLRLALLGTAVGFILMLIPVAGLDAFDPQSLRQTLTGMSSGMAIALNVTVTGIATALLLKFEYYLLDEAIADLFHEVTELTEVYVVPTLEPKGDVPRV